MGANIWVYRHIGPNELGLFATSVIAIDLATVFANLGVNQFIIRFPNSHGVFGTVFRLVLGQAVAFTLLTAACLFYLAQSGNLESISPLVFVLVLASRILNLFSTLFFSPLEGELAYRPIVKSRLVARTISIVSIFVCLPFFKGSVVLGLREACYALFYCGFAFIYARDKINFEYSSLKLKAIFRFTAPLYVLNILERTNPRIDLFFVRSALGNEALGVYYGLRQIFEGFYGFIAGVVQTVLFSVYNNINIDRSFLHRTIASSIAIIGVSTAVWATSFLDGHGLTRLLLGEDYVAAGNIWLAFVAYFGILLVFENSKVVSMSLGQHNKLILPRLLQALTLILSFSIWQENMSMSVSASILFFSATFLSLISLTTLYHVRHSRNI